MLTLIDKSQCCGCTACASICPKQAITMQPDGLGFLYPVINGINVLIVDFVRMYVLLIHIMKSQIF